MIRYTVFLLGLLLTGLQAFSQMFILNEDFGSTSGTTPPVGWTNNIISGSADDQWHFDNPGGRILNYPVTDPFAIFDSETISSNGLGETVALETGLFDASTSNYILLNFVHVLDPSNGAEAIIEAFDGNVWHEVATYTSPTENPQAEIVDLSGITGGITNAKVRFIWSGHSSGFWAIDNIRIYASLPYDGSVVSIDSPDSPVAPGMQNVEITLGNFGYNMITFTQIYWTVDGVAQPRYDWSGSVGFGETESNIVIGTYDFQEPVTIKVWQTLPNGQPDLNPYNDTITKYVAPALCGTYTIGGANPDFETFGQAASILNTAGVTCPVTFLVRDGTYLEQFELGNIQGVSEENRITFRSESNDSTKAILKIIPGALKFESMIYLNGSKHIYFDKLGMATGSNVSNANNAIRLNGADNIGFTGCHFISQNQYDYSLSIQSGSHDIVLENNNFTSISAGAAAISIADENTYGINISGNTIKGASDWGYYTIRILNFSGNVNIDGNLFDQCYRAINLINADSVFIINNIFTNTNEGVFIDDNCQEVEVSSNRFLNIRSHPNVPEGTSGIAVNEASAINIFNNFIHTSGSGAINGVKLSQSNDVQVYYNSINITNNELQGNCYGIKLDDSEEITVVNNIFRILYDGFPVYIDKPHPQLDFDHNNYYNLNQTIGYYNGSVYDQLSTWQVVTGMDANTLSAEPFYSSATDLSINQVLLNNAGMAIAGIDSDIDGLPRDPANPDIGAKEYTLCQVDAGINEVTEPENPVEEGVQTVRVILQNQGIDALSDVSISWAVNGISQEPFAWSGNIAQGENAEVQIGSFDFQPGILYAIRVWTDSPNNTTDCNNANDTISSRELAVALCGTYSIGGSNPDFSTFSEAIKLLNLAGINCPVTFLVRNGTYYELLTLKHFPGTSAQNTVTFRSVSGDSSQAVIRIKPDALKYQSMIYLDGAEDIYFEGIGFITGPDYGSYNNAVLLDKASRIGFSNCYFESRKEFDLGVKVLAFSHEIDILQSRFECISTRAAAIEINGTSTSDITIGENHIKGTQFWGFPTIKVGSYARKVDIVNNYIERCTRAIQFVNTDSALVQGNYFTNCNDAIFIDDFCSYVDVVSNRLINIKSHDNAPNGTSAIKVDFADYSRIYNNFIHTSGEGPSIGISLQNADNCQVSFNSVNITNTDNQGKSKGIFISASDGAQSKNNIFNISNLGTPVQLGPNSLQPDFDHNDYNSFDQTIGFYNGQRYTSLQTWRDSLKMDYNSISVIPFFSSPTDLSINQTQLNNAGIPVTGISTDIDGDPRNPATPDIGAKEYELCPNDAGINAVISPVNPLGGGTEDVRVTLQNQGSSALTSANIMWKVNDELQAAYNWSGNLAVAASVDITIGQYDFHSGSFIIKAWTTEPNSSTDCNPKNDTIESRELAGSLCGTYTIGGIDPDFASFNQAATVLNTSGISCPVSFLVRDGVYVSKFIIEDISGASAINTITFVSESGDSSKAILQIDPDALNSEPMVYLNGAQHIHFIGLGFTTGSNTGISNPAMRMDGATDIVISGCYFQAKKESDLGLLIQAASQDISVGQSRFECIDYRAGAINITGQQTRNISLEGNHISGPANWGSTMVSLQNRISNINFSKNTIERSSRSIYLYQADSITISQNTLKNSYEGIYINGLCSNVELSRNRLVHILSNQNSPEGTHGIFIQNSDSIELIDNFVHTAGDGPVIGINLNNVSFCRIHYNTVNTTNIDALGKSKGIYLNNCSDITARNNLFSINVSGLPIHIDANVTGLNLDYSNYYHPGGIIGKINNITYTNLFEWGQINNTDANSRAVNPYFKADTIPLPYQRILNGSGIPVAGIIYDIDGKLRHNQAPDIGCMEFFVDFGVLELLSPTLECYHPDVDSVKVYIRQYGDVPFENLKVAYQMDNDEIHIDTVPGPVIYDFIHTFSTTETISTYGNYLFKIWLIGTLDDNINNDTLRVWRYSKPAPELWLEYDNMCTGWEVYFTGTAQVLSPYYIDGYEWIFGDGDTSYVQNPVHTFTEPGTYDVIFRAYSDAGCYSQIIETLVIDSVFQGLQIEYLLQDEVCLGDGSGRLELYGGGGNPPYTYYVNGEAIAGNVLINLQPGTYEIMVEDSRQCVTRDTVESNVLVSLNAQAFAEPLSGYAPLTVDFGFTANYPESWIWHFPDNHTDSSETPTHTFIDYGYYTVVLEVNSGPPYYCIDTSSVVIFADIIILIDANNVFTPNGDGANDYFEITSSGIEEIDVIVFNQWGMKIKEFDGINEKWDGSTDGGSEAPDGTYYWSLTARGVNQEMYDRQGSVLLLRHGAEAYPNPATDKVAIKTYQELNSPVRVEVFSVFGQLVRTEILKDPKNIFLDMTNMESGIYFFRISDDTHTCYVRIIKK